MAGRLLFVFFMYVFNGIQTEARLPPKLTVNSAVITETDSVTLNCQTPSYVSVSQCYYQTLSGGTVKILSCLQTLTGSELLRMDHQSSPAEVKVKCFYTVQSGDRNAPSPHSDTVSISIQSETNSNKESLSTLTTSVSIITSPADQGPTVSLPDTKELWNWTFVWVFAGCGSTVIITVIVNVILWKKRRAGIVEKESRRNQRMPSLIKTTVTGSEGMERSESRKSNRSLYHIYSTIYEGQTAAASKDMIYSKLQAH
ncbi:uncharacterized protein LOC132978670 isoform X9 [Labrus mixtus]|uniref:uncharacterized protein LOC132978670 isoform X9 n=1 Tax=Labrus mixtus TaxID=508554 RepID=UPI0029C02764|nr:uncharacterized protein LOC132978670 isoform X9 [Labrus mixtus]